MSFSTNLIAIARRLLNDYGESISLSRVTEGAYDPTDGSVAAGSTTNYSADGHPFNYTPAEVDDTTIKSTDLGLWLAKPTSQTPIIGDIATVNSLAYRVINVEQYRAQGTDVVYKLQLRL